jgi:thiol-disulfide isomerase/thioredoxin
MTKKLYLVFLSAILVASCSQLGDNEFLVKGKIDNFEGKTIFLSEIDESGMRTVDSVIIDKSGEFKLTGKTSFPKFYLFRTSPNDYITLLIDSANVLTITADANNLLESYKVEGTPELVLIKNLNDRMQETQNQIDSLGKIYQSLIGTSSLDSAKKEIDAQFNTIVAQQQEFSRKFVETNSKSMVSLLALSQQIVPQRVGVFNIPDDLSYFEKVDSELYKLYPESKDVQALHTYITSIKSQEIQQESSTGFKVGDMVPDISLNNPQGKELSLYSLKGKYVLLDFWAGWCKPCRMESPVLVENYKKYNSKGFEIFQVSLDKDKSAWIDAINKDQLNEWYHVSDLQYWQSAPARAFNISSIPANFLLNPKGEVIAMNLRGEALGAKLAEIFQ